MWISYLELKKCKTKKVREKVRNRVKIHVHIIKYKIRSKIKKLKKYKQENIKKEWRNVKIKKKHLGKVVLLKMKIVSVHIYTIYILLFFYCSLQTMDKILQYFLIFNIDYLSRFKVVNEYRYNN